MLVYCRARKSTGGFKPKNGISDDLNDGYPVDLRCPLVIPCPETVYSIKDGGIAGSRSIPEIAALGFANHPGHGNSHCIPVT